LLLGKLHNLTALCAMCARLAPPVAADDDVVLLHLHGTAAAGQAAASSLNSHANAKAQL
jgi:hypothetical protein